MYDFFLTDSTAASPQTASLVNMHIDNINNRVLTVGLAVTTSVLSVTVLVLILLIGGYWCSNYCRGLKKGNDTPSPV